MTSHKSSDMFHLVISVKNLQDINDLDYYYQSNDSVKDYIITIESGTTGHQHLESFVVLKKPKRQDKFREQVINALYKHIPKEEYRNIKCTINYLDPDPRYAIGYSLKEDPKTICTSFSNEYLEQSKEYYFVNQEKVNKLKAEAKERFKGRTLTVDIIACEYLEFCKKSGYDTMYYLSSPGQGYLLNKETYKDISFKNFMIIFDEMIPFSLYQKINQDKLLEWCDAYLQKKGASS